MCIGCRYGKQKSYLNSPDIEIRAWKNTEKNKAIFRLGIPFYSFIHEAYAHEAWSNWDQLTDYEYVYDNSVISLAPAICFVHITGEHILHQRAKTVNSAMLSTDEISTTEITRFINPDKEQPHPTKNIIFLLVESLESWVIDATDEENRLIAPNLHNLVHQDANLYCDKICSEVRDGVSGDGQMIVNTGILPLPRGAVCMLYGNQNTFPNWAHLYEQSMMFVSNKNAVWNQDVMTYKYGYRQQTTPHTMRFWDDANLLDSLSFSLDTITASSYCCQVITVSTHTPFGGHDAADLHFAADIPTILKKYLSCIHYTDSCIGIIIQDMHTKENLENDVLFITGDHTIFKSSLLQEFKPYAKAHNLPIQTGKNYVPLIVYSPSIRERTEVTEECYQMDIYPTLLHLIGCEDYYWKGFGVNLLDSVARQHRPCTEEEAYRLSDKLIRSNYFASAAE